LSIAPGATYYLRWTLTGNGGSTNGQGLGLDNFSITASGSSCISPTAYGVTGGGSYCSGGAGVAVGLANSESGVSYQLYRNGGTISVGSPVSGTGAAISFGNQTTADTYTVVATRTSGGCNANMTGSATVSITTQVTP